MSPTEAVKPQNLELTAGETARLAYFDVTLLRSTTGQDQVSHGWKVRVCYTHRHPGENSDGTTRVSSNPWQVLVKAEGASARWVQLDELTADEGWQPPYPARLLSLGECAVGWLAVKQELDVAYQGLRYAPADFGDVVTWRTT